MMSAQEDGRHVRKAKGVKQTEFHANFPHPQACLKILPVIVKGNHFN